MIVTSLAIDLLHVNKIDVHCTAFNFPKYLSSGKTKLCFKFFMEIFQRYIKTESLSIAVYSGFFFALKFSPNCSQITNAGIIISTEMYRNIVLSKNI